LAEVLRESPLPDDTKLLVLVDQFEEIFRFRNQQQSDEAEAFVSLLLETARNRQIQANIVLTMRSDFIGECVRFRGLPEALNDGQFLVPRLDREQVAAAIRGPARVFDAEVEPMLVNALLNEYGPDPDCLPALQHLMMRVWRVATKRAGAQSPVYLRREDTTTVGGVRKALSLHADEVLSEMSPEERRIAEALFKRLVDTASDKTDTRRPASVTEVSTVAGVLPEHVEGVVDAFAGPDRSFLLRTPSGMIDISHESLIRQWATLDGWVRSEAESARMFQRLSAAAQRHAERDDHLLWSNELLEARTWWRQQQPSAAWAARYVTGEASPDAELQSINRLLTNSLAKQPDSAVDSVLGRASSLDMTWRQLGDEEQLALRILAATSPERPFECVPAHILSEGVAQILSPDDSHSRKRVPDYSRLQALLLIEIRWIESENERDGETVCLSGDTAVYVRSKCEQKDIPYHRDVFVWAARYFSVLLENYNAHRNDHISGLSFLQFEDEHYILIARRWLDCIAEVQDLAMARLQWLTFVFSSQIWWNEYCQFPATYKLIELWKQTPFFQSGEDRITLALMERFVEDYPQGEEWQTRDVATDRWAAVANSLKRLRLHIGINGPYPSEDGSGKRLLRAMIDDYLAEALWHLSEDGAEEMYLESIEAYWDDSELNWVAPFNHTELAEFYLTRGHTALALRQCHLALRRGKLCNEWGHLPAAPEEPEVLAWIYRVCGDALWQLYSLTGDFRFADATVDAALLSVWYAFVLQGRPRPADAYTTKFAEEVYTRAVLRFGAVAKGDWSAQRDLCALARALWPAEPWPEEVIRGGQPASGEEQLRQEYFPPRSTDDEDGPQRFQNWVERVIQSRVVRGNIRQLLTRVNAVLRDALKESKQQPVFQRITTLDDRYTPAFLDLLQENFPPEETVRLSALLQQLRQNDLHGTSASTGTTHSLEVILNPEPSPDRRECRGILWIESNHKKGYVIVWYFAIRDKGRGLGTRVWNALARRFKAEGLRAMVWAVERPDQSQEPSIAQRRIDFYLRVGGRMTDAVYYHDVFWCPATPMHLMIQPLVRLTEDEASELIRDCFGNNLKNDSRVEPPLNLSQHNPHLSR